jgi:methyl-accepting chemotaxis protein
VDQVGTGTQLVEMAGGTIQALVLDVKRVSGLMGSIAEASAEQSRGVQQVNKTVTEMDKVVQQNASAVQQSAAAAEGMRRQAEALVRAVSAFRLDVEENPVEPLPARRRAERIADTHNQVALAPPRKSAQTALAASGAGEEDWKEF